MVRKKRYVRIFSLTRATSIATQVVDEEARVRVHGDDVNGNDVILWVKLERVRQIEFVEDTRVGDVLLQQRCVMTSRRFLCFFL